jgi:hypothetical protein
VHDGANAEIGSGFAFLRCLAIARQMSLNILP